MTIKDITEPARVTRASFYYYFPDKAQLFYELGTETYLEAIELIESFTDLSSPPAVAEIRSWVVRYFLYLDRNGAYINRSSEDLPPDRRFRAAVARSHRRTAQALGDRLAKAATATPEIDPQHLGVVVIAMIERSWLAVQSDDIATVEKEPVISAVSEVITKTLT